MKSRWKIAAISVVPLVVVQLLSMRVTRNPAIHRERSFEQHLQMDAKVKGLLRRACLDCHSHETRWPWYSRLAPVSWLIHKDVQKGRKTLNFSEWSVGAGRKPEIGATMLASSCEAARSGRMPRFPYSIMHPEARLNRDDLETLCSWTKSESKRLIQLKRTNSVQPVQQLTAVAPRREADDQQLSASAGVGAIESLVHFEDNRVSALADRTLGHKRR